MRPRRQRAEHPEIRQLAADIVAAQEGEISVMKTIRRDMHGMGAHGDSHMGMCDADMGMDMDMDPAMLQDAKPFDKAFIDMMVAHHQGAVAMATQQLRHGEQSALRQMSENIIDAQTREIAQMRKWRTTWYGSARSPNSDHGAPHTDG
jgi:uncharacterized protein (DUF305 family)